jgi:hypothetical protein
MIIINNGCENVFEKLLIKTINRLFFKSLKGKFNKNLKKLFFVTFLLLLRSLKN